MFEIINEKHRFLSYFIKGTVVKDLVADGSNPGFLPSTTNITPVMYETGILIWKDSGICKGIDGDDYRMRTNFVLYLHFFFSKAERKKDRDIGGPNPRLLNSSSSDTTLVDNSEIMPDAGNIAGNP